MTFDTRPAAYAVVLDADRVLLVHERNGWTLPGGGLELGETPEDACLREVREETGLDVQLVSMLELRHCWLDRTPARPLLALGMIFQAVVTGGAVAAEEGSEVVWVPLDQLEEVSDATGWPAQTVRLALG